MTTLCNSTFFQRLLHRLLSQYRSIYANLNLSGRKAKTTIELVCFQLIYTHKIIL